MPTGWNRIGGDPGEFGFHVIQVLEQTIELGRPAQLLILVDVGELDSARLGKGDDVGWVEATQPRVFSAGAGRPEQNRRELMKAIS